MGTPGSRRSAAFKAPSPEAFVLAIQDFQGTYYGGFEGVKPARGARGVPDPGVVGGRSDCGSEVFVDRGVPFCLGCVWRQKHVGFVVLFPGCSSCCSWRVDWCEADVIEVCVVVFVGPAGEGLDEDGDCAWFYPSCEWRDGVVLVVDVVVVVDVGVVPSQLTFKVH